MTAAISITETNQHAPKGTAMPTFDTPGPISATVEVAFGDVRIVATDRTDTVVEVQPSDPAKNKDVQAAEKTRVDFGTGSLRVKTPRQLSLIGSPGSVDVTIELPSGSDLRGDSALGPLRCSGRFGDVRLKTAAGDIDLEEAAAVNLTSGIGDISVDRVTGDARVNTGSGAVRLSDVSGSLVVKNSNGDTWVGAAGGDVRVNAANGAISVDHAHADVEAKSANGDIRLGEVVNGEVSLSTALGELEVGVREGTATWLDVNSQFGNLRSSLEPTGAPEPGEQSVRVRARTSFGDILVHPA